MNESVNQIRYIKSYERVFNGKVKSIFVTKSGVGISLDKIQDSLSRTIVINNLVEFGRVYEVFRFVKASYFA